MFCSGIFEVTKEETEEETKAQSTANQKNCRSNLQGIKYTLDLFNEQE
jgi:hypothetical protein